jgi:hypothetical protein
VKEQNDRKTAGKYGSEQAVAPVLRLRDLAIGVACITILIAWPLLMISRQIVINNLSMRESALADSLASVGRLCAAQRFLNEKLSSTARIESIMREHRGLEYPSASRIIVIREPRESVPGRQGTPDFFAIIKKPFSREKG